MNRRIARLGVVMGLLFTLLLSTTSIGVAAAAPPADQPAKKGKTIRAAMVLDCVNMTVEARRYADEHGYCDQAKDGEVQPAGTAYGNCGSSWIEISGSGVSRQAHFDFGAHSTRGWITYVTYTVLHYNDNGYSDTFGGSHFNGGGATWTHSQDNYTDRGWVEAELQGVATLAWGGTCQFLGPTDYEWIP